jgi:hypothetical protein
MIRLLLTPVLLILAEAIAFGFGRVRCREQWDTDLRDASELGISRWLLAIGALRTAMYRDTRPSNASGAFVAGVVSLTMALLVDSRTASWRAPVAIVGGFSFFLVWRRNWGALALIGIACLVRFCIADRRIDRETRAVPESVGPVRR